MNIEDKFLDRLIRQNSEMKVTLQILLFKIQTYQTENPEDWQLALIRRIDECFRTVASMKLDP